MNVLLALRNLSSAVAAQVGTHQAITSGSRRLAAPHRAGVTNDPSENNSKTTLATGDSFSQPLGHGGRAGVPMRALFVSMAVVSGCKTLEQYNQAPDPTQAPALPTQITKDCNNYTYNGQTYDCSTMDACDFSAESIPVRVACCDCDPALCEPVGAEDCPDGDIPPPPPPPPEEEASSCMECHNGSNQKDYKGTGISNPHWVSNPAAQYLECTQCHGGNPDGLGKDDSHVPRPPELGDDAAMVNNPVGYWNYLTR